MMQDSLSVVRGQDGHWPLLTAETSNDSVMVMLVLCNLQSIGESMQGSQQMM